MGMYTHFGVQEAIIKSRILKRYIFNEVHKTVCAREFKSLAIKVVLGFLVFFSFSSLFLLSIGSIFFSSVGLKVINSMFILTLFALKSLNSCLLRKPSPHPYFLDSVQYVGSEFSLFFSLFVCMLPDTHLSKLPDHFQLCMFYGTTPGPLLFLQERSVLKPYSVNEWVPM